MTTAHHLLATTWDQDNSGGFGSGLRFIDLYDFDIAAPRAHVRRQTLRIPIGSRDLVDVRDLVLSPDSRELAWRIHCERDWRALWLVRWLPPFLSWSPKPGTELWVSRLDGTRMRLVGTCPDNQREDSNDREYEPGQPRYVRWTPDGRRLSFYWRRAIWTVAAD